MLPSRRHPAHAAAVAELVATTPNPKQAGVRLANNVIAPARYAPTAWRRLHARAAITGNGVGRRAVT